MHTADVIHAHVPEIVKNCPFPIGLATGVR